MHPHRGCSGSLDGVAEAFPQVSGKCPWCDAPRAYPLHMWWTCPHHAQSQVTEIASTQWMIKYAKSVQAAPCLWLRGIAPVEIIAADIPVADCVRILYLGQIPAGKWPGGKYYTDGSGGKYGSIPLLRRCGCGIAALTDDGELLFHFGAAFALEGKQQSVPRAELYCFVVLCLLVENEAEVHVATDSDLCAIGVSKRQ